jgi:hypothetical protein
VIPVAPNSDPATEIEEIVTAAVPEEASVTTCVPVLPTKTFPKDIDEALTVKAGVAAFNCSESVLEVLPVVAVRVAGCEVPTTAAFATNAAVVAAAGTVTEPGTVTELELLARLTFRPPVGAAPERLTVHASASDPVMEVLLQETAFTVGVTATPAPLMLIAVVDALLEIVAVPV